jgi:hypothetical protein
LQEGLPGYSIGSFPIGISPSRFYVTSVAVAANVVTLGVKQVEGNVALSSGGGALVSVGGTVVGGATVNVSNVAITGIFVNAQGVGTIVYPATAPNLATTPDGGTAIFTPVDVGETTAVQKCMQLAVPPSAGPETVTGRVVTWSWLSTAATIALQLEAAIDDVDAQYTIVGTSQTTLAGTIVGNVPIGMRFLRVNITAFTGGPGATWAKILI